MSVGFNNKNIEDNFNGNSFIEMMRKEGVEEKLLKKGILQRWGNFSSQVAFEE